MQIVSSRRIRRNATSLKSLDAVLADLPGGREIHVIVDNYSTHKKNAEAIKVTSALV